MQSQGKSPCLTPIHIYLHIQPTDIILHSTLSSITHLTWNSDKMTEHERVARCQGDLLPHVVDRLARERPNAKYGEWATESNVVTITYAQLANAINGLAGWLVEQLGPGRYGTHPDVLTYVGPNDVRYSALVLAAIKTGYVVRIFFFPFSPLVFFSFYRFLYSHFM